MEVQNRTRICQGGAQPLLIVVCSEGREEVILTILCDCEESQSLSSQKLACSAQNLHS
jgi:hypothetical protein